LSPNCTPSSCPRLSRVSTLFLRQFSEQGVDGRDKPGHDSGSTATRPEFHFSKSRAP
jgi:hypothetical protein